MKKSNISRWIVIILSFQLIAPVIQSQIIEAEAKIGYAIVDLKSWSRGIDPNNWSNFSGSGTAQVLFPVTKSLSIGVSAGFHHLFWYSYRWKDIYDNYHYVEEVANATPLLAIFRFNFGRNFVDFGAGPYFFKGYSDFSSLASIGHSFRLTDKLSLPVKLNCNIIFDSDSNVVPITIGTGLSYSFK